MSPLALKTIKRVLNTSYDTSLNVGFEVEGHAYEKLRESEDYKEGHCRLQRKAKAEVFGRLSIGLIQKTSQERKHDVQGNSNHEFSAPPAPS